MMSVVVLSLSFCSPTGNKLDTSPRIHRMFPPFFLSKTENTSGVNRAPGKGELSEPWQIGLDSNPCSFTHSLVCICIFHVCVSSLSPALTDESTKVSWGINIMKKGKKMSPKAFGVRLEDCLPAANNKVSKCYELVLVSLTTLWEKDFRVGLGDMGKFITIFFFHII